jgi:hypothetical protein
MNEISMTMMFSVTVIKQNGNSETWTFTNFNDRDDFLDHLDELSSECEFEVSENSWFANSLEGAKQEVEDFLGIDEKEVPDV